ncbi:MAG TPA: hypothetical protein VF194_11595 [Ferrovibrio sp.]|jgi:hypothetical protein|uniref:hypothetical protein n=1 Tax=Ferrovibrio sp. TaxID=1917215 RepID=UPI002ED37D84
MSGYVPLLVILFAGLIGTASAQPAPQQQDQDKERAAIVDACVKEMRSQLKPGQTMTNQQRMDAEQKCRDKADAIMQAKRQKAPKR